jgi:putative mycofactocin binding protein MftB
MESAVSTELAVLTRTDRREDSCYAVTPPVRVRKEAFGLLFYNTEDSRLTFVKSRDLLQIKALPHGAKRITASLEPETQSKVRKLLDHLLQKRLICES